MAGPPYLRIADAVAARIADGALRPGDLVPSARALRDDHGVALATATRALAELRRRGLTVAVPGVGTRVADPDADRRPRGSAAGAPQRRTDGHAAPAAARRDRSGGRPSTRDVVRVAVRVADAEGMPAVSIRRIAAELGLPTMAVYRYVPDKDHLVRMMTDEVFGEVPLPRRRPARWRAALELSARLQWELHRRHPWLARTMSFTRPVMAPRGMAWTEWLLAVLADHGLPPAEQLRLALTVAGFVHGMAAKLENEVEDDRFSGMSAADWMALREAEFTAAVGPMTERFPLLAQAGTVVPDEEMDLDALFEVGLEVMLDGIAVRMPRRRRAGARHAGHVFERSASP